MWQYAQDLGHCVRELKRERERERRERERESSREFKRERESSRELKRERVEEREFKRERESSRERERVQERESSREREFKRERESSREREREFKSSRVQQRKVSELVAFQPITTLKTTELSKHSEAFKVHQKSEVRKDARNSMSRMAHATDKHRHDTKTQTR
jgi:hypothetical protein